MHPFTGASSSRVWKNVGHGALDLEIAADNLAEWLGFVMREIGLEPR